MVPAGAVAEAIEEAGLACSVHGDERVEVRSITHDSRAVGVGALFACLRGATFDGHEFADDAVGAGASALLVDHVLVDGPAATTTQLVVDDTRLAVGPASSIVHGRPSRSLTTVGITGTNGKTTTAQLVAHVLERTGRTPGVVGTLHGPRTTPEAPELQATLAGFLADGREAAVMEVSSHALALHRVDGTSFDVVAFTNFGHDHLDLHGTPEEYFRAKSMLFDPAFAPVAVVNVDDPHGRLLADTMLADGSMRVVEVGDAALSDVRIGAADHRYRWRGREVVVPLGGDFNVTNSHVALEIAVEVGVDPDLAVSALADLGPVPGRFELVASPIADRRGIAVVVDYAHTPDGLDQLLRSARGIASTPPTPGRVIAVFGCGGDRDREKRPAMGAVAAELADMVVVTSDNPRHEPPEAIIDAILDGVPPRYRARVVSNVDRRSAIAEALSSARRGDIVVVAGKGHETTQDLGHTTIDFDDRAVVHEVLDAADSPRETS